MEIIRNNISLLSWLIPVIICGGGLIACLAFVIDFIING
jgi:hypothetical protein